MEREQILEVKHHSDGLFSFKTTRYKPWKNQFESGKFTSIDLDSIPGTMRAYSVASTPNFVIFLHGYLASLGARYNHLIALDFAQITRCPSRYNFSDVDRVFLAG